MIWMNLTRPKRPTRPASTPTEGVIQMTDTERKYKAAFMALLEHYRHDVYEYDYYDYCHSCCPFRDEFDNGCPACVYEEYHDSDYDAYEIDEDKCREEIFNWYVEKAIG